MRPQPRRRRKKPREMVIEHSVEVYRECVAMQRTCGTPGFEWPLDLVSRWWSALSEDSWTIAMCSNMSHSRSSNNIARQNALLSGKDAGNRTSSL